MAGLQQEIGVLDLLNILGVYLGVENYTAIKQHATSDDIIHEINLQTKVLLDRIESKLDKILENQAREESKHANGL